MINEKRLDELLLGLTKDTGNGAVYVPTEVPHGTFVNLIRLARVGLAYEAFQSAAANLLGPTETIVTELDRQGLLVEWAKEHGIPTLKYYADNTDGKHTAEILHDDKPPEPMEIPPNLRAKLALAAIPDCCSSDPSGETQE